MRILSNLNPALVTYKVLGQITCSLKTLIVYLPELCDFELCTIRGIFYICADRKAVTAHTLLWALEMGLRNGILLSNLMNLHNYCFGQYRSILGIIMGCEDSSVKRLSCKNGVLGSILRTHKKELMWWPALIISVLGGGGGRVPGTHCSASLTTSLSEALLNKKR